MELLQFKANISQDCIQRMWHGGYFLRKLSERAADLDALEPWWACRQSRHCLTRAYHGEEWRVCNTRKVWGGSLSSLIWVCLGRLWWRTPDICIRRLHPFWFTFCRYSWCHGADFFQRSHQEIWRLGTPWMRFIMRFIVSSACRFTPSRRKTSLSLSDAKEGHAMKCLILRIVFCKHSRLFHTQVHDGYSQSMSTRTLHPTML